MKFAIPVSLLALLGLLAGCASEMSRGSAQSLYSIADPLEVRRGDIGKSIQLRLDQKLLFLMDSDEERPGRWELADYTSRNLLLLSDTPRVAPGYRGFLLQGRTMGGARVVLRFTPEEENAKPTDVKFDISIRR